MVRVLTSSSYNYDPSVLYNDAAYPIGRFSNEFGFHSSEFSVVAKSDLY